MYLLKVGEPYVAGKHSFAPVTNYNFRGGQHELLLILDRLTDRDIEAARKAEAEFALVIHRRVLFLLYRFGEAFQWSDAPYSIWLLPEHERLHPQVGGPDSRALLTVILVRAEDGIVQGLRGLTLPPMLTAELQRAIGEQFSSPLSIREYEAAIADAYRQWPNTESMLSSAVARGKGGA